MKKLFVIFVVSLANISYAQAGNVDLLSDDILMLSDNNSTPAVAEGESSNKGGILNFIKKPLSLFFSEEGKNPEQQETYIEKTTQAADNGSLEDQMNLAYMYLYGTNGVQANHDKALYYYDLAAQQNDPVALNNLGSLYFSGIGTKADVKKALALFNKAAELGNDNAAVNLAFIYLTGGKKDSLRNQKAFSLLQKASKSGNKIAKFMLGYAYYKGFVVNQNYETAFKLISSAAGENSMIDEAQIVLAQMYINGRGTVQNYTKAVESYRNAVQQGNVEAYMKLGEIYAKGEIYPVDPIMAHALFNIAAAQNTPDADKKRDRVAKVLKLEELTAAQSKAQEFTNQPSELTLYIRQTYGNRIRDYIDNNIVVPQENMTGIK